MSFENKNVIFTITHGRTGTAMLTEVFKIFDDIRSEHEPEPNYARVFPDVKRDPRAAIPFLKDKINSIVSVSEKNYIETSNVFGKGFFIPMLRMGFFPKLIFLNREFRKVAESLYKRGSYPMRTMPGRHFSSDPSFPGGMPIFNPDGLTNYQMCYWGVLDAFYRQLHAEEIYKDEGGFFVWASAYDFNDFSLTCEIGEKLGLTISDRRAAEKKHKEISSQHHNPNKKVEEGCEGGIDFDKEEAEVLDRVAFYDPLFVDKVIASQYFSKELAVKLL